MQCFKKGTIRCKIVPYLFIFPLFLLLGVFKLYSSFSAIVRSFFEWNGGNISNFVGLDNYIRMMGDTDFWNSLWNLLLITLFSVVKVVTIPLLIAELVMRVRSKRMSDLYKYTFVIPMVVPAMVITLLWQWIYDYNGLLNGILRTIGLVGLGNTSWLGNAQTALGAIIGYNFPWIAGIQFLIFLSGLQSIPESLYEAASLEGINPIQRLFRIDIPLLSGQFRYLIITTITTSFQAFEHIMVMTNGGPGKTTMVPALYLYQESFSYFRMGYACALGTVLFVVILALTALNMNAIRGSESGS